jgi:hypothetical protein
MILKYFLGIQKFIQPLFKQKNCFQKLLSSDYNSVISRT